MGRFRGGMEGCAEVGMLDVGILGCQDVVDSWRGGSADFWVA